MPALIRDEFIDCHGPVIDAREHPRRARSIRRWATQGYLTRLAPSIYAVPSAATSPYVRMEAVCRRLPHAVITGEAAAFLTGLSDRPPDRIEVALPHSRRPTTWATFVKRHAPSESVVRRGRAWVVAPAAVAVDRAAVDRGATIDAALRTGLATLEDITQELTRAPHRPGNLVRRRIVERSRSQPWSPAERDLHDILDAAHLHGWVANFAIRVGRARYAIDVAFPELRIAIEVDGWTYHSSYEAFARDRRKQNDLARAGWLTLRFTAQMMSDPEYVVSTILEAIMARRSLAQAA